MSIKKIILSLTIVFLGISIKAQTVTEDNIYNYVQKIENKGETWLDPDYVKYYVKFTDGEFGDIYYNTKKGAWYSGNALLDSYISKSKSEALVWLWKREHRP